MNINKLNYVLGAPMRWIYSVLPNFAISLILYLLLMRMVLLIFDYNREVQKSRTLLAKPFLFKLKEKFLGREGDSFADSTLEIFKATKYNYFNSLIYIFVEYPIIIGLFFTLYHPISIIFPDLRSSIPAMSQIAKRITDVRIEEIGIIRAIHMAPEAFAGFDISSLTSMKTTVFGINILNTASSKDITIIFPLLTICYYACLIVKMLIPVFKKESKLRAVALPLSLYIFVGLSISASAFSLPLVFYCYLMIYIPIGKIASEIMGNIVKKRQIDWVRTQNGVCQQILKKYGIDEYVSAIKEDIVKTEEVDISE